MTFSHIKIFETRAPNSNCDFDLQTKIKLREIPFRPSTHLELENVILVMLIIYLYLVSYDY